MRAAKTGRPPRSLNKSLRRTSRRREFGGARCGGRARERASPEEHRRTRGSGRGHSTRELGSAESSEVGAREDAGIIPRATAVRRRSDPATPRASKETCTRASADAGTPRVTERRRLARPSSHDASKEKAATPAAFFFLVPGTPTPTPCNRSAISPRRSQTAPADSLRIDPGRAARLAPSASHGRKSFCGEALFAFDLRLLRWLLLAPRR